MKIPGIVVLARRTEASLASLEQSILLPSCTALCFGPPSGGEQSGGTHMMLDLTSSGLEHSFHKPLDLESGRYTTAACD